MNLRGALLATLTAALWGGTPVAISFSVDQLPPLMVAGIRFLLGALFMVFWCRVHQLPLGIRRDQWSPVVTLGFLLFLQISTFNLGIAWSSSSHATVLINLFVLWVAAIEHFVTRRDRLSPRRILGLLLAASAGATILVFRTERPDAVDPSSLAGDLMLVLSSVILGIKIIWTQVALKRVSAGPLIFWHDVVGVALFLVASLAFEQSNFSGLQISTWLGLLYQGILVAGLCFAIQAHLLDRHPAAQVAVFSCSTPVFGIIAAIVLRSDPLSSGLLVAAILAASGIWLVTRVKRPDSSASPERSTP